MTGLVPFDPEATLAAASDPEGAYLALCERGLSAIADAASLQEGKDVLGLCQTLAFVAKVKGLHDESCLKGSALAVAAERRMGELIREERAAGQLAGRGRPLENSTDATIFPPSTLADHGIPQRDANRYQQLASLTEDEFTEAVEEAQDAVRSRGGRNISGRAVLAIVNPEQEKSEDARWLEVDGFLRTCRLLVQQSEAAIDGIRWGAYPGEEPLVAEGASRALAEAEATLRTVRSEWERRQG